MSLMNTDAKKTSKKNSKLNPAVYKKKIVTDFHLSQELKAGFNIWKFLSITHHINRLHKKNYMFLSIDDPPQKKNSTWQKSNIHDCKNLCTCELRWNSFICFLK